MCHLLEYDDLSVWEQDIYLGFEQKDLEYQIINLNLPFLLKRLDILIKIIHQLGNEITIITEKMSFGTDWESIFRELSKT